MSGILGYVSYALTNLLKKSELRNKPKGMNKYLEEWLVPVIGFYDLTELPKCHGKVSFTFSMS